MPASAATSLRRSPGTRRRPTSGSPACAALSLARRVVRNSLTSARLSTDSTIGADAWVLTRSWGALLVHPMTGTPPVAREGVGWRQAADRRSPPLRGVVMHAGLRPHPLLD